MLRNGKRDLRRNLEKVGEEVAEAGSLPGIYRFLLWSCFQLVWGNGNYPPGKDLRMQRHHQAASHFLV